MIKAAIPELATMFALLAESAARRWNTVLTICSNDATAEIAVLVADIDFGYRNLRGSKPLLGDELPLISWTRK